MKKTALNAVLMALGTLGLASIGTAAPLCSSTGVALNTLDQNSANQATGCSLGAITFNNFTLVAATQGGTAPLPTDANINVAFTETLAPSGLPQLNVIFTDPSQWTLAGSQQNSFTVTYTVTAPSAWFLSYQASVDGTTTGSGVTSLVKSIGGQADDSANNATPTGPVAPFLPANTVSTFNVSDNIQVLGLGGTAMLNSATNSFVVPEPMTSMLLGTGLLAFGLMLRRKRN